jgi:hypothetical protein
MCCGYSFGYRTPYFPEYDGVDGLETARKGTPGEIAFVFERTLLA